MLSGLLIVLDILVCVALICVVLLQRSEGGAFGMGGGPTGLVTARGASDLLTRTTWILFALFLGISLALTLLGAHDRATSSMLERLKLQQINPGAVTQPQAPAAPSPAPGSAPSAPEPQPAAPAPFGLPSSPAPAPSQPGIPPSR